MPYKTLRSDCVIETIDNLVRRIEERFPDAGLRQVCGELASAARQCAAEAERLRAPQLWIRCSVYGVWLAGVLAAVWTAKALHYEGFDWEATSFVQLLEPAMNIVVLVGIGVVTLGRVEERWKRARALDYLHELRSIAHVVDMHQLTKDPYWRAGDLPPTAHSPKHKLSGPLLERYFDYCTEMLSLTGKLAAIIAESSRDAEVAAAASDVEALTTGLARKIWQKIMVMGRYRDEAAAAQTAP